MVPLSWKLQETVNGTFEPQIVKKHQATISDEIEAKILPMYGLGMSYRDIFSHVEERSIKYQFFLIECNRVK